MPSRLFSELFLPGCLAIGLAVALVAAPQSSQGGGQQEHRAVYEDLKRLLDEELKRGRAELRLRAGRIEAKVQRMRRLDEELKEARTNRRRALEDSARIQAEVEALREAYRKMSSGQGISPVKPPSWAKVAPEQIAEAKKHGVPVAFENDLGMRFVLIPAGTFVMGQPNGTLRASRAQPQHEVILTRPLYVQTTELTNEVYRRFRPKHSAEAVRREGLRTPRGRWKRTVRYPRSGTTFGGYGKYGPELDEPGQPVTRVSWHEATSFAAWLTAEEGPRLYRLPTEAEWEYACRAGTTTAYAFGETLTRDQARFGSARGLEGSAGPRRALGVGEVGNYPPNAWGLHDMHGNVLEWCADWFGQYGPSQATNPTGPHEGDRRVIRGGSAHTIAGHLGSAERWMMTPDHTTGWGSVGFRLVCPLPEK